MSDNIEFQMEEQIYNKRVRCEYTPFQQQMMELKKQKIILELKILGLEGISEIYENQEIIAYKVITGFKDRKIINIMVVSKTQSGKTGSMCATIKKYLEDATNLIPIENIYIITGLSSCEWKEQTRERLPASVQVFHRCDLPSTFVDEIKNKKNVLIIMDEIQVAAKKDQTIYKSFQAAGLLDKQKLYENDIKILEYTATPDGTIYDLMKWNDASFKILAEVGDRYVSSFDLLQQGRVKQYKDICGYDKETTNMEEKIMTALNNIRAIKTDIDSYAEPKWHIVRTKNGIFQDKTLENFVKIFGNTNYIFIKHDRESEIEDINKTLKIRPNKHTIILIKEMLRCAKTLHQEFLGVSYERCSKNPDDASIIQGLIGRNTGYKDNGVSICYTNIDSIERYEKLWISNFEDKTIRWNSKTTIFKNGILNGKDTFNDPKYYDGFSVNSDESGDIKQPKIKECNTHEEAKEYYISELKSRLGGRGPNKMKPNNNGFYEATIRSNKRIYSCDEITAEKRHGLTDNNYRFYPCYKDTNDKNTLQWFLIHY